MVNIHLSMEDLAHTRFAFSALWEAVASYRILRNPERHPLHLNWVREAKDALHGLDLSALELIIPNGCYPDFLTPPPTTPLPDFTAELEQLASTPAATIRNDIETLYCSSGRITEFSLKEHLQPFLADPKQHLARVVETLEGYWQRTLESHWPRIRALLEADILYRARSMALNGPEQMFNELHPRVRYHQRTLQISKKLWDAEIQLSGRGLLLVPSVFIDYTLMYESHWQETMQYGARGIAGLWCLEPPPASEALEKLLGINRARLLKSLVTPSTTRDLSSLFRVTPSAVSQHLGWLRDTGLISPQRQGKNVYYRLSQIGEGLLDAYGELEPEMIA